MKNNPDPTPPTSKELFSLMRLIQHLAQGPGGIPGAGEVEWQEIYDKLNAQASFAHHQERGSTPWASEERLALENRYLEAQAEKLREGITSKDTFESVMALIQNGARPIWQLSDAELQELIDGLDPQEEEVA